MFSEVLEYKLTRTTHILFNCNSNTTTRIQVIEVASDATAQDPVFDDEISERIRCVLFSFWHIKKRRKRSQHLHGVLQMDIDLIKNLDTQHLLIRLQSDVQTTALPPRKWHARESVHQDVDVLWEPSDGGIFFYVLSSCERTVNWWVAGEIGSCVDALNVQCWAHIGPWRSLPPVCSRVQSRIIYLVTPYPVMLPCLRQLAPNTGTRLDTLDGKNDVFLMWWNTNGRTADGVAALPRRADFEIPRWSGLNDRKENSQHRIVLQSMKLPRNQRRFRYAWKLSQPIRSASLHVADAKIDQRGIREEREIYFSFQWDFHRCTIPAHLNHMGDDLSRGLLIFSENVL